MKKSKAKLRLPETLQLEISEIDDEGEIWARPTEERFASVGQIVILSNRKIKPPLAVGDRVLARIDCKNGEYYARVMLRTSTAQLQPEKQYGVIEKRGGRYFIVSTEKSKHTDLLLDNPLKAKDGDFVAYALEGNRRFKEVRILRNFGPFSLSKAAELLVLEKYGIPNEFSAQIAKELTDLPHLNLRAREDLTNLPFVTIDGDDSKDFDDAVWAEKTPFGFRLGVAIADVAFYVRPGCELDREAYKRGNSVYLPNMVVPMLPEKLSNDLCSLRPKEKRPVIACFMEIDNDGKLRSYDFCRGTIKSAARLTYREVQAALDGDKSENIAPVFKSCVLPLYEAYLALDKARKKRGALELTTTEIKIKFDKQGQVLLIEKAPDYMSEKIIEEFMIAANVAAALALEKTHLPVMYRVHDRPPQEKLKEMEPLLHELGMKLPDTPALKPMHFNKLMEKTQTAGLTSGISDLVLRMQAQAQYSPENIGHFGLGLQKYGQFTSPIRRASDLQGHYNLRLQRDNKYCLDATDNFYKEMEAFCRHISATERNADRAEKDANNLEMIKYVSEHLGEKFVVRVSYLTSKVIFVKTSNGIEGRLYPEDIEGDVFNYNDRGLSYVGKRSHAKIKIGTELVVTALEANRDFGTICFGIDEVDLPVIKTKRKGA